MAVLLKKVMLHQPKAINPQPISQLRLLQSLLKHHPLIPLTPRPRHLMLIKQPKLHARSVTPRALFARRSILGRFGPGSDKRDGHASSA